MTQLSWNTPGENRFEAGVSRGVLYTAGSWGVPWNGLVSVTETPIGGEITPYYIDGNKYVDDVSTEEFAGSIEAYTYPDQFAECDGTTVPYAGVFVTQQMRKRFGLSYQTTLGNDLRGLRLGYRIHLVYNALVAPSSQAHTSMGGSIDPLNFSWNFTTKPINLTYDNSLYPLSHIVVDSTKARPFVMRFLQEMLYGTSTTEPFLPSLDQLIELFSDPRDIYAIIPNEDGIADLFPEVRGDVVGDPTVGIYESVEGSRLIESNTDGIYHLE